VLLESGQISRIGDPIGSAREGMCVPCQNDNTGGFMGSRTDQGAEIREELLLYMCDFREANGYTPSLADLARKMGMNRTAVIWHLSILRDEGLVQYADQHLAHSLALTGQGIHLGNRKRLTTP
jgi:Bacterial regulatory protein, arsR family